MDTGVVDSNFGRHMIADDNHAKSVLRRILRDAHILYEHVLNDFNACSPKSRRNYLKNPVPVIREATGEALVYESFRKLACRGHRKTHLYCSLDRCLWIDEHADKLLEDRIVPLSLTEIDTKSPDRFQCVQLCIVTEHALARVIRRNQCFSLKEVVSAIKPCSKPLATLVASRDRCTEKVVILGNAGYAPCGWDEASQLPVMLSCVSRQVWDPEQEAKLELLAEDLDQSEIVSIDASEFNSKHFLDPGDYA